MLTGKKHMKHLLRWSCRDLQSKLHMGSFAGDLTKDRFFLLLVTQLCIITSISLKPEIQRFVSISLSTQRTKKDVRGANLITMSGPTLKMV